MFTDHTHIIVHYYIQGQLKDAQQEVDNLRVNQGETTSRLKEAEKKWRNLDVELQQSQEVANSITVSSYIYSQM